MGGIPRCKAPVLAYLNTKTRGDEAEIQVLLALVSHGYSVAIPFGENQPYDLVAEHPSNRKLFRIQVRCSSWQKDVLTLRLEVVSKNYRRRLDFSRIDWFAIWDGKYPYFIPVVEITTVRCFSIRRTPALNGQLKGVRSCEAYRRFPE